MPDENGDPYGYELLIGTGSVSVCSGDEEFEVDEPAFPFGFRAPVPQPVLPDAPELTSSDWARWLDGD